MKAIPVLISHGYDDRGRIVSTEATPKSGAQWRDAGFWQGAWQREDGSFFYVAGNGVRLDADTPAELVRAIQFYLDQEAHYAQYRRAA